MKPHTTTSKLVTFFYLLMRDEITPGVVEKLVRESENCKEYPMKLSNGHLAEYADELVKRLERR